MRLVPDIAQARALCKKASTKEVTFSVQFNNKTFVLVKSVVVQGRRSETTYCKDKCRARFRTKFLQYIEQAEEFQK